MVKSNIYTEFYVHKYHIALDELLNMAMPGKTFNGMSNVIKKMIKCESGIQSKGRMVLTMVAR